MKNKIILFVFIFICFSCVKKGNQDSKNIDNRVNVGNANDKPITDKIYTFQEQIENYKENSIFLFQEEGNFTNSLNKEILVFYCSKSVYFNKEITQKEINSLYCFLCDESNQKIIKAIEVKWYGTLQPGHDLDDMPMEPLGREIRWLDQRIGFIGDFNNNGKEELYFYEANGWGLVPKFYEFQEDDFKNILDYESYTLGFNYSFLNLVNVDTEKKIITFSGDEKSGCASFIWNKDNQIYEKMVNTAND